MSTANFSLPFPTLGDVPNVPGDVQALAEATDTALAAVDGNTGGKHIATGVQVTAVNGQGQITITFPVAFGAAPFVMSQLLDATTQALTVNPQYGTISSTGFTVVVQKPDGTPIATGSYRVGWLAVGDPA